MNNQLICGSLLALASAVVFAGPPKDCPVKFEELQAALSVARASDNGGLGLDMWGTVVNADGRVCAVAKTGSNLGNQWLASRVISAQKAYTADSLSNNKGSFGFAAANSFAFSTAGLYLAVQPGGPLYGLHSSNPVDTKYAYAGNSKKFGSKNDPMVGRRVGGVNTFGGGLALFDANDQLVGGLGVSGDTSCADHNIAMRVRNILASANVVQGPTPGFEQGIDYAGGYPDCGFGEQAIYDSIISVLSQRFP